MDDVIDDYTRRHVSLIAQLASTHISVELFKGNRIKTSSFLISVTE